MTTKSRRATGHRAPLAVAATTGTMALAMLLAPPALAADGQKIALELSHDGVNYSPGTVQDIFANTGGYVPGESRTGTIWVRNASADAAQFSLGIVNPDTAFGSALPAYLNLHVSSGRGSANASAFPAAGACEPVLQGWTMAGGEALQLELDMGLALQAPNATRNQASTFGLVFVLQGIGGGTHISPCAGAPTTLPGTALPAVPADNVAVGTVPLPGGTAQAAGSSTQLLTGGSALAGADAAFLPVNEDGVDPVPQSPRSAWRSWLWNTTEQSNVVANIRSPWPWIAFLSAGAYMAMSFRRRKRNS
ncbi:hypothetical protein ACFUCV_01165 [Specibacter sp. NPDC057265]|uniref:hypothetical protein n=1 Tax=Specibacter sp. NPDC057265 TaxID=3346075 RepID=UPI0036338C02